MNFELDTEVRLFGEAVRAAIGDWEAPREPKLGVWLDDRDDELADRLARAGWQGLWEADLGVLVAGAIELGRAVAPMCLVDEVALGAPLSVGPRVRHGAAAQLCAVPLAGWGLTFGTIAEERRREPTLDGSGTILARHIEPVRHAAEDADDRWAAWTAATLGYLAGLAEAAQSAALAHARSREQFGRRLAAMPAIQARLADSALATDGLLLSAWQAAARTSESPRDTLSLGARAPALLWAGAACRDVTASAQQVHGAIGFALETGLHRYYRRAKSAQVWAAEVCRACA